MGGDLTDKQRLFCHEYLKDLNGTQAAIRAGYSENSAQAIATENLSKPLVSEYLNKLKTEKFSKVDIEVDDIINDIILTRKEAAEDRKHTDRLKANELLGKYKKIWTDKVDVSTLGKDGQPVDPNTRTIYIEREDKQRLEDHISQIVDE